jgi:hypothetical protein
MDEGGSADFAAGVATAVAAQADEEATTAAVVAEQAAGVAEVAQETAWNAQDAVTELRYVVEDQGVRLAAREAATVVVEETELAEVEADDEISAPEAVEGKSKPEPKDPDEGSGTTPKKKHTGYGAGWIYGKQGIGAARHR